MTRVTVTAFTAARMMDIEQNAVVSGRIVGDNLVLTTKGGSDITAGHVRGIQGIKGDPGGVWDATPEIIGGVKMTGNLGGTAQEPTVTGILDNTVDVSATNISSTWVNPDTAESIPVESSVEDLLAAVSLINHRLDGVILAKGEAVTLWAGTEAEYLALPAAERNAVGFIGVVRE